MQIKTKLSEKDYIQVNLLIYFRKITVRIFYSLMLVLILAILIAFPLTVFLTSTQILIFPIVMPLIILLSAKKSYKTNYKLAENIAYTFDNETFIVTGETFNSQLPWEKIHKVVETKNWLLIWQNRMAANPIPKRDIMLEQLVELKNILELNQVKHNL